MNTAADCMCRTKSKLAFELVSESLCAHVDNSDMASFDGVVVGSFVAQVIITTVIWHRSMELWLVVLLPR